MVRGVEIPIDSGASAIQMAQTIFGNGVTVVNASYTGDPDSSGIYTQGDSISPGVMPSDTGVMFSTGDLRGFTNSTPWWSGNSNQSASTTTSSSGPNNLSDFNAAAGAQTFDASFLDVDFIPTGDLMTMRFVFASEEFPEYAVGAFQDFVGVWINGTQVELSVGDGDIDPNNLNAGSNANLFVDNTNDQFNTEMDGFTVAMTLTIPVNSGQLNSIRIGIADVTDDRYDSTLIIAGDSVQTTLVALDDSSNLFPTGSKTLDVLANDVNATGGTLRISHINGQPVVAGSVVTLATGQSVTVNPDGTLTISGDGDEETVNFTYDVTSTTGSRDTGFVTLNSIPCFTRGTRIETDVGPVAVQHLQPGMRVLTRDNGFQPIRWVGQRRVEGTGRFTPVRIRARTFGATSDLLLSPLHRVLIEDPVVELFFGEAEVLVAARDLVDGIRITFAPCETVDYFHLLFDRHQIVFSEGVATESFLPGPQIRDSFEAETLAEICVLFPELDPATGHGYGQAARPMLKRHEAHLLASRSVA